MHRVSIEFYIFRNARGSLGERETPWKHEPTGECFYSFLV